MPSYFYPDLITHHEYPDIPILHNMLGIPKETAILLAAGWPRVRFRGTYICEEGMQ